MRGQVLFDAKGHAKIIDLGLASVVSSQASRSHQQSKVGTDTYMSPEKAHGEAYGYDAAVGPTVELTLRFQSHGFFNRSWRRGSAAT